MCLRTTGRPGVTKWGAQGRGVEGKLREVGGSSLEFLLSETRSHRCLSMGGRVLFLSVFTLLLNAQGQQAVSYNIELWSSCSL